MAKQEAQHEETPHLPHGEVDHSQIGFEADETNLPPGYFYSRFFIGSFLAIGFSLWAGTAAL
jgi:hypothetical protein